MDHAAPTGSAARDTRAAAKLRSRRQELALFALVASVALSVLVDLAGELGFVPRLGWPASECLSLVLAVVALWHWRRQIRHRHGLERTLEDKIAAVEKSERRYRDFAEAASHYVWEVGPDLRFTYVSDSIERITGDRPEEIIGKTREEIRPDDPHTPAGAEGIRRQMAAGVPFVDVPITRTARDGRTIHLMTAGKPFYDDAGNYLGYRCYSRDVTAETVAQRQLADSNTALQRASEALAESERRFRDFANAASDWFWETGPDHRFTFILLSDAMPHDEKTGSSLGLTRREANPDGASAAEWDRHEADLEAHRPFRDFRFVRMGVNGQERHLSVNGIPVFDREGRFQGYRGTGRDLTLQVLAEEAASDAARARDRAEAASRAKSQFLAHTSHELRTPLNAIIGFSEVMQREMLGPIGTAKYAEYARDIRTSAGHLLDLINDMLDMARIEIGKYRIEPEERDPAQLVEQVLTMTRGLAEAAGITISSESAAPGIRLYVDGRAIKQVLVNLVSNGIKFTPAGGRIVLRTRRGQDGGIAIAVADTGRGIPAAALPTLFEPFQQANAAKSREGGGAGLGLWISRNLMRMHGGELTIDSAEGRGTTATLTLPPQRVLGVSGAPDRDVA